MWCGCANSCLQLVQQLGTELAFSQLQFLRDLRSRLREGSGYDQASDEDAGAGMRRNRAAATVAGRAGQDDAAILEEGEEEGDGMGKEGEIGTDDDLV